MTTDGPGEQQPTNPTPGAPNEATDQKPVGWVEVLFDLVFVFAVTGISTLLHRDHSGAGIGRALVVFVPVYWAWVGTVVHTNTHDVDNSPDRLGILILGLCALFMALAVPAAYAARGLLFGAAYLALRTILAVLVWRGRDMVLRPFLVPVLLTGPLLLAGGFLSPSPRLGLWALAAMIDLATPALARGTLARARFAADHLQERFALFVIIALGESIVAIGVPTAATPNPDAATLLAAVVAFVLIVALWWLYFAQFGHTAAAIPTAMASAPAQTDVVRQILVYAHLALIAAIIAIAAGIRSVLTHPDRHLETALAGLLFGGSCLYLVTLTYTQRSIRCRWSPTHLFAAATTAGLLAGAGHVPALAALASLAAVLAVTNVVNQRVPPPRQPPQPLTSARGRTEGRRPSRISSERRRSKFLLRTRGASRPIQPVLRSR